MQVGQGSGCGGIGTGLRGEGVTGVIRRGCGGRDVTASVMEGVGQRETGVGMGGAGVLMTRDITENIN